MNKVELQKKRNDVRRLLRHSSGIHVNCIRLNIGNTLEHERAKFEKCWELKNAGEEFLTEAVFENGLRADVVNLDRGMVYEIIASEGEDSLKNKAYSYPLPIIKIYL